MVDTLETKPAYTVREVAEALGLSRQTVTRMFENERGMTVRTFPEKRDRKRYRSLRIPRAVLLRVLNGITVQ